MFHLTLKGSFISRSRYRCKERGVPRNLIDALEVICNNCECDKLQVKGKITRVSIKVNNSNKRE